jgi:hypothetical protein
LFSFRFNQSSEGEAIVSYHLHYFNPEVEAILFPKRNMILSWPAVREALSYYPALWQNCE